MVACLVFCWTQNSESGNVSDSFTWSWDPFPVTGWPWPALIWGFVPYLILSCCVMFCWYSWEACSFWEGNGRGIGLGERLALTGRKGGRGMWSECIENKTNKQINKKEGKEREGEREREKKRELGREGEREKGRKEGRKEGRKKFTLCTATKAVLGFYTTFVAFCLLPRWLAWSISNLPFIQNIFSISFLYFSALSESIFWVQHTASDSTANPNLTHISENIVYCDHIVVFHWNHLQ